jgi:UDP-glucose 4-epimerase
LDQGEAPQIFGTDYPTPDGSCIRDYIHVSDLSAAHVAAADLVERELVGVALNVGTGVGASVVEVMDAVSSVVGRDVRAQAVGRRAGDPPELVAQVERSQEMLSWSAQRGLTEMVESAYAARR